MNTQRSVYLQPVMKPHSGHVRETGYVFIILRDAIGDLTAPMEAMKKAVV